LLGYETIIYTEQTSCYIRELISRNNPGKLWEIFNQQLIYQYNILNLIIQLCWKCHWYNKGNIGKFRNTLYPILDWILWYCYQYLNVSFLCESWSKMLPQVN